MRIRGYAPGTPCWANVAGPDRSTAQRFYGGMFGWTLSDDTGWLLRDRPVAGYATGRPPGWLMYVAVDGIDEVVDAVLAAGGQVVLPAHEDGSRGRAAVFADPTGATFAVWQRGTFSGAQVFNEPDALCWYELASPDLAGTAAFYGAVFGWQARTDEATPGGYEWINGEDAVAGLVVGRSGWQVHLMVADCSETAARVIDLGGRPAGPPTDTAMCRQARLLDPAGASFVVAELAAEVRRALL